MNTAALLERARHLHQEYTSVLDELHRSMELDAFGAHINNLEIETIQRVVADHYVIPVAAMHSKIRTAAWSYPRQVAMYLARSLTKYTNSAIGASFGSRNRTTIDHAVATINDRIGMDDSLAGELAMLKAVAIDRIQKQKQLKKAV